MPHFSSREAPRGATWFMVGVVVVSCLVVCGSTTTTTTTTTMDNTSCTYAGGYDLTTIGTVTLNLTQEYINNTLKTYVINLCQKILDPPPGTQTPCSDTSYISEYSGGECDNFFPTLSGSSVPDSTFDNNVLTLTFAAGSTMNPTWTAVVNLACDESAYHLASPTGASILHAYPEGIYQMVFKMTTRVVCRSDSGPQSHGPRTGMIAGAVLGVVLFAGILTVVVVVVRRRRGAYAPLQDTERAVIASSVTQWPDAPLQTRVSNL